MGSLVSCKYFEKYLYFILIASWYSWVWGQEHFFSYQQEVMLLSVLFWHMAKR